MALATTVGGLASAPASLFTVMGLPAISALTPSGGRAGIGVTVSGANFSTTAKVKVERVIREGNTPDVILKLIDEDAETMAAAARGSSQLR